jgi:hypothetical protein
MPLVGKDVSSDQPWDVGADPQDRGLWRSPRRCATWSGQAVLATTIWCPVVVIDLEERPSCGPGERCSVCARTAACAGLKVQREAGENDADRREPRQAPTPSLPVLPSDHPSSEAGDECRVRYHVGPFKPCGV